ncbi:MAG: sigma-70 family RNA polymerase sigma factor [Desulfovermiculus sp.]
MTHKTDTNTGHDQQPDPEQDLELELDEHDVPADEEDALGTLDVEGGKQTKDEEISVNLPVPTPSRDLKTQDALSIYLREINAFPPLDANEEFELARRFHEHNDHQAAFRLITSHLRLVVKIAMEFQRKWMKNVLELIQEGNIGLMKAVQKFNPDRGIKFSYYAAFWIKAYILKFIMDNWRMVKIGTTQSQRKLFYNLGKERQRLENLGFDPNSETLSKSLDVSKEDVEEMSMRMGQGDLSLDSPFSEDTTTTRMDLLPALEASIEDRLAQEEISDHLRTHIKTLVPQLNDKEKRILYDRLLAQNPVTLREIGDQYGITRERVRQIESRLLQKLRGHLSESIQDFSADWISHE